MKGDFLNLAHRPRRKAIALGLLRTTPFVSAGVLALVLFWQQPNYTMTARTDGMLFIIFVLLSITVFFSVSRELPYTKKDVIRDLLASAGTALGKPFRLNILELVSVMPANKAFWEVRHHYNILDVSRLRRKIGRHLKGVNDAFNDNETIYVTGADIDASIDPYPKHIWSVPIRNKRDEPIYVLNIDCNIDQMTSGQVAECREVGESLARLIEKYEM